MSNLNKDNYQTKNTPAHNLYSIGGGTLLHLVLRH